MRVVADDELERGVDLIVAAVRAFVALDDHGARALLDHDERAGEQRGRLVAGRGEHQMDRPLDRGAGRDVDHDAVAHERGVERDRDVARSRPPCRDASATSASPCASACAIERMVRPVSSAARSDSSGDERAVDEHQPPALDVGEQRAGVLGARLRGRVGRRPRAASRRASARAGRCISTPRRGGAAGPLLRSARTRPRAAAPRPAACPSPPAIRPRAAARRRSSSSGQFSHRHSAATRRFLELRVAAALRARAPAPCRRSSRCGPSTAHARRPARCSRAGAGSA